MADEILTVAEVAAVLLQLAEKTVDALAASARSWIGPAAARRGMNPAAT